jgi:hypothetical protein
MNRDRAITAFETAGACVTLLRGAIDDAAIATTEMDAYGWSAVHWTVSL